jgi:8-oxo-dGTP diphosphatase
MAKRLSISKKAVNCMFRLSAHAVIINHRGEVLRLKASYGSKAWGLPGGIVESGETIHRALIRECREELGIDVVIGHLTGIYYHPSVNTQVFIFRCEIAEAAPIRLSDEHSEWGYFPLSELDEVQRKRVDDCLAFNGKVNSVRIDMPKKLAG